MGAEADRQEAEAEFSVQLLNFFPGLPPEDRQAFYATLAEGAKQTSVAELRARTAGLQRRAEEADEAEHGRQVRSGADEASEQGGAKFVPS